MTRSKPAHTRFALPTLTALLPAGADLSEASTPFSNLSNLTPYDIIIIVLASTILLLIGILIHFRQIRRELLQKSTALANSERHIRLTGDNLPNGAIFQLTRTADGAFHFPYLSKGYTRILGFEHEQENLDPKRVYDHVYEADLPVLRNSFEESRTNMAPVNFEMRILDISGKLKWLNVSAVPSAEGDVLVWDGFLQDVSANKNMEIALVEENRNFHNLFKTIDDFLLICDMDGRLLYTNPIVKKRLGYTDQELKDMSVFELYSPEKQSEIYRVIARMQSEASTTVGMPLQTKSGSSIPVEMNVFQGYWQNRTAIFGVARDIARRKETENALRESQQMLQLIMDTIPMSVFWKDKDSVYLGCNKTFMRECGLSSYEDVVGHTPFDLFPHGDALQIIERDQEVIRNNHPLFNFILSNTRADGSIGWRECSKIPLRDEGGRSVGVLGVWRDVTEQNRAEDRLKRTLEDMERFNQLMRGRERRTLELKEEINALHKQLGQPKKYKTTTENF
ncbi:PAS domain S-box protein [Pontiellaceae bacterium B12219]|nr:PAS domain S-box protein [Pontiellaceae bacterium B12219]